MDVFRFSRSKNKNSREEKKVSSDMRRKIKGKIEDTSSNVFPELELDDVDPSRALAFKAGFISIRERMKNLESEQSKCLRSQEVNNAPQSPDEANENKRGLPVKTAPQFATLQELFSSKSSRLNRPASECFDGATWRSEFEFNDVLARKKPKIPIMKLSKEDWNVKCWEERLKGRSSQARQDWQDARNQKPNKQIEVFQGRIEDVAMKLEKVREGQPLDETLYKLLLNKGIGEGANEEKAGDDGGARSLGEKRTKSSHEWTDLLKKELENRVHNPKHSIVNTTATFARGGEIRGSYSNREYSIHRTSYTRSQHTLRRPIRRIFEEEEQEQEQEDEEKKKKEEQEKKNVDSKQPAALVS